MPKAALGMMTKIYAARLPDHGGAVIAEDMFPFSTGEVFNVDGGFHLRPL